ncbi:MAG TPA: GTP cyclohydrolase I FolE [Nitrososphaeraceae archaeon]|nr:GTP cyclohydrolase I FolE [Nitrososphaeraceae archaeon]
MTRLNGNRKKTKSTKKIEKLLRQLLIELGENPDREGLIQTPARMAEMYEEIFGGYRMNAELDVSFSEETDAIVAKNIEFYSMCEHHMLPFYGKIHIAYIPSGKVLGISKLARLVEKYARRMQIQERLTKQIADEIIRRDIKGVLVIAEAEHLCMKMRGVKNDSLIITVCHRGIMEEQRQLRDHVLSLIYASKPEMRSV